jgi:hypothetical protein
VVRIRLTVDQCSACHETIAFDRQMLTLLDETDSHDHGGVAIDVRSRWRLRADRPGRSLVRLTATANGSPRISQVNVLIRDANP